VDAPQTTAKAPKEDEPKNADFYPTPAPCKRAWGLECGQAQRVQASTAEATPSLLSVVRPQPFEAFEDTDKVLSDHRVVKAKTTFNQTRRAGTR
jgi:hypothetical protein